MAIINTFQKCLESPYLFEDKEAPTRIVELLAKAGDRLDAAVNIHTTGQGDPADIVSDELDLTRVQADTYLETVRAAGLADRLPAANGPRRSIEQSQRRAI